MVNHWKNKAEPVGAPNDIQFPCDSNIAHTNIKILGHVNVHLIGIQLLPLWLLALLIFFCLEQPSNLTILSVTPCPCWIQMKRNFVLALRALERNAVSCGTSFSWSCFQSLAILLRTLFTDAESKRARTWVCPPEGCCHPRLILDYVGMGAKGLVIGKEAGYVEPFKDEVGYCPIHNKFMCWCWLEIGLRKRKYFFKKITRGINIRAVIIQLVRDTQINKLLDLILWFLVAWKCTTRN